MQTLAIIFEILRRVCEKAGPYFLLELLLPGGTLVALLLYLYRRRKLQPRRASIGGSRSAASGLAKALTR